MKIKISGPGTFTSNDSPVVGTEYILEDAAEQSDKQRKLFHSLCKIYYDSGCHSYKVTSWWDLREKVKYSLGEGFSHVEYVNAEMQIVTVKKASDVPPEVIEDFNSGNKPRVKCILKSTSDYTKKQYREMTDHLIREMLQNEVVVSSQGKKFEGILKEIDFRE